MDIRVSATANFSCAVSYTKGACVWRTVRLSHYFSKGLQLE